ncbi:MAG: flagellar brake protein [Vampirovibrionia bacterium]
MELIQVNKKAELVFDVGDELITLMCDIKGVTLDTVLLSCPIEDKENLGYLHAGKQIDVKIYSYSGIIILSSIVRRVQDNVITITMPEEKERVQRREYFRVGIQRPVEIRYDDGYKERNYFGKTIDISGGGVRFWTKEHCHVGFMAEVIMQLNDICQTNKPIRATGRIIYNKSHDSRFSTKGGYINVVKFHEIEPKARQLIVQACFKIQIEMRKKGIL